MIDAGDPDAVYLHYIIQELHWGPDQIDRWLDWEPEKRAFVIASMTVRAEKIEKEKEKLKNKR